MNTDELEFALLRAQRRYWVSQPSCTVGQVRTLITVSIDLFNLAPTGVSCWGLGSGAGPNKGHERPALDGKPPTTRSEVGSEGVSSYGCGPLLTTELPPTRTGTDIPKPATTKIAAGDFHRADRWSKPP